MSDTYPWEQYPLHELEEKGIATLGRGNIISKKDIQGNPGSFPVYSSSAKGEGLFGTYGDYMFDDEMITWSVDGGGNLFYRPRHKFSVTNVSGYMRLDTSVLDYRFAHASLALQHSKLTFDYQTKAHPSVIRNLYHLPIPPLPEQKKIAEILSGIDLAISGVQRKIEKLRSARVALMESELRGDRQTNFADTEIGITPSHWKVKGILEVSSVASGQVDPTTKNYQDMILIAPNHIESGTGKVIGKETAIQQGAISGKYFAKKGSVILSKIRPNLAKVCMADHDCLTSADMYPITAGHEITPGYLKQVLLSKRFTQYATESSVRGNIPKINREELSGYKFGMPPLDEQEAIVSSIESVEQTISIEESRVCLLLALKNSLSSDLLSGRKRVSI